ncbi:MAG: winged helix-turn-helix transcriptional regulator [Polyangiaceae bacterium]|nr:winged helix-turn-helix transcriptional regulator [Polyangiaceae bacterium]
MTEFGARATACHDALQLLTEARNPATVLVLVMHRASEHDAWQRLPTYPTRPASTLERSVSESQGLPLCRLLRELGCAARMVCLDPVPNALGKYQCAADVRIEAPRTPAGVVKILSEIRSASSRRTQSGKRSRRVLGVGDIVIDVDRRRVLQKNLPLELTKGQYDLLVTLVESEGRVIPFDELHRIACNLSPWTGDTRAVRQQVSKLVRKLGDPSLKIENVRGFGYALIPRASPVG